MPKKMLINANAFGEARVAVLKDGILEEINMQSSTLDQIKGNIYLATVVHVDSGLEAAFINYGADRHGFIPLDEIPRKYFSPAEGSPPGEKPKFRIARGTKLLLQVEREPIGHKGASFTGFISLPGRYLVIMPFSAHGGVSRKIEDPRERERLKSLVSELGIPANFGVIIRTAGLSVSVAELKKDYDELIQKWETIQKNYEVSHAPGLLNADLDLVVRSVRDYFSTDFDEVLIDDPDVHKSVLDFFNKSIPECVPLLKFYREKEPLFVRYNVEDQIEGIFSRSVQLPTGGSIVIDSTEALTAIDVNSGTGKGVSGQEKLSFEINQAAAVEIARQLKLRDLGGLVVIDFIDMKNAKHRSHVRKILQQEMKKDKARVELGHISKFGLLELSRQRVKMALLHSHSAPCPRCQGSGLVQSVEFMAAKLLGKIFQHASRVPSGTCVKVTGGKEIVEFLSNAKRKELQRMESDFGISLHLFTDPKIVPGQEVFSPSQEGREKTPERPCAADGSASDKGPPKIASKRGRRPQTKRKSHRLQGGMPPQAVATGDLAPSSPPVQEKEMENLSPVSGPPVEGSPPAMERPKTSQSKRRPRRRFHRKKGMPRVHAGGAQNSIPAPPSGSGPEPKEPQEPQGEAPRGNTGFNGGPFPGFHHDGN